MKNTIFDIKLILIQNETTRGHCPFIEKELYFSTALYKLLYTQYFTIVRKYSEALYIAATAGIKIVSEGDRYLGVTM